MKKFRKILALVLMLVMSINIYAEAAETTQSLSNTGTMPLNVSVEFDDEYTVTIPREIKLSTRNTTTIDIVVSGSIVSSRMLFVCSEPKITLSSSGNPDITVKSTLDKWYFTSSELASGTTAHCTFDKAGEVGKTALGEYTGVLDFNIKCMAKPDQSILGYIGQNGKFKNGYSTADDIKNSFNNSSRVYIKSVYLGQAIGPSYEYCYFCCDDSTVIDEENNTISNYIDIRYRTNGNYYSSNSRNEGTLNISDCTLFEPIF